MSSSTSSVKVVSSASDSVQSAHHFPPLTHGYRFVQHLRSALSHDTFIAEREETKESVVIRIYALEYLRRDEERRLKIEREHLLSRLTPHPSLNMMLTPFTTPTDLYTVEPYCSNGELFEYLQSTAAVPGAGLPLQTVQRFARSLLEAVHHLHSVCRVAHRNVKLESLYIDSETQLRLGGFGLCTALPHAGREKGPEKGPADGASNLLYLCCGSKHYAAPELVRGEAYHGEDVDTWACGVVLFAMAAGCFPFDSSSGDDGLYAIIQHQAERHLVEHPAYRALSDPQLKDLLLNMLRVNPKTRLSVSEALDHPFLKKQRSPSSQGGDGSLELSSYQKDSAEELAEPPQW